METLRAVLGPHLGKGQVPGVVALVGCGDRVEVQAVGSADADPDTNGAATMARDSIFRIASVSKPLVAAAVMMLVDDGRIALDDPVAEWLPELSSPLVVRTPDAPVDDVVPAVRPITVRHLLDFRAGYGFAPDPTLPALAPLVRELRQGPPRPQTVVDPDTWLATLARIPLLHQPGEAWLYHTCSDLQGVLIARVTGRTLPEFLTERLFEPLGMADTGFTVPAGKRDRFTSYYRTSRRNGLELIDAPDGQWSSPPPFPSGGGGLVSTAADLHVFARMLLAGGTFEGRRLLSPAAVRQMTTDQLTAPQREAGRPFLDGQGWGFGGSVDVEQTAPWNVPGRYGWVGATGTSLHLTPATGTVVVVLSQRELTSPKPPALMRDVWRWSAAA